jgi:hypothetical protein
LLNVAVYEERRECLVSGMTADKPFKIPYVPGLECVVS